MTKTPSYPHIQPVGNEARFASVPDDFAPAFAEHRAVRHPEELDKTPEQTAAIEALRQAVISFGDDMGVNLRDRVPTVDEYHFFANGQDMKEAGARVNMTIDPTKTHGVGHPMCGIFIVASGDTADDISIGAHETMHFVSSYDIRVIQTLADDTVTNNISELRSGLLVSPDPETSVLWAANEMVTDMAAADVVINYMRADIPYTTFYSHLNAIGGAAARKISETTSLSQQEFFRLLVRNALTGDATAQQVMASALGVDALRALTVHAQNQAGLTDKEAVKALAHTMGLPEAAAAIESMKNGALGIILPWKSVHNSLVVPGAQTAPALQAAPGASSEAHTASIQSVAAAVAAYAAALPAELINASRQQTELVVSALDRALEGSQDEGITHTLHTLRQAIEQGEATREQLQKALESLARYLGQIGLS